jgi:hypothetical protein
LKFAKKNIVSYFILFYNYYSIVPAAAAPAFFAAGSNFSIIANELLIDFSKAYYVYIIYPGLF